MTKVVSRSSHTVGGKFRKAGGSVDGINLAGCRPGTAAWQDLGRFNPTPFTAQATLAGAGPEEWEFQATVIKRDVPIGEPSVIAEVIVRV